MQRGHTRNAFTTHVGARKGITESSKTKQKCQGRGGGGGCKRGGDKAVETVLLV